MNNQRGIMATYAAALRRYLAHPREVLRQKAYELGREALSLGLGVLDMARIHQEAVVGCRSLAPETKVKPRVLKDSEAFFLECLSPFEAAHRGFCTAQQTLRRVNEALQHRNAELEAMNRALEREVNQRQRAEQALQKSGDHYRQLFHEASLMQERLRSLSSQILHAQEEERKRISRELHDEVGQALTAIGTRLAMLPGNGSLHPDQLKQRIGETQRFLGETMETVHRFARELRPAMLDELGLLPALDSYLRGFAERTGIRVRLNGRAGAEELGEEQKTVLFRVTQESLTNVAKHAAASRITVTFHRRRGGVRLQIKDNGRGFEAARPLAGNGAKRLGLLGMAERLRLVNGHLTVTSTPGEGTMVSAELPYQTAVPRRPRETTSPAVRESGRRLAKTTTPAELFARP